MLSSEMCKCHYERSSGMKNLDSESDTSPPLCFVAIVLVAIQNQCAHAWQKYISRAGETTVFHYVPCHFLWIACRFVEAIGMVHSQREQVKYS